ncbi:zinc finger A20 and AN1 domain-containing stress-associated protein 6 [Drosophila busckii]|uniref:zinc finger A20 and AN1 domain-containing stress-associated protein 6 n=1 Tax=Drosophila busckii TaxID=30019 RepID=UPI00083EDE8F|nr:zinc finger A20 and AN1 domain-containing stress-associated protein 6 [Drosophila busckii]
MENRKIRDFGNTQEDAIDSLTNSNDNSSSRTLPTKIIDSNSSPPLLPGVQMAEKMPQQQQLDEEQREQMPETSGAGGGGQQCQNEPDEPGVPEKQKKPKCDKCGKKFGLTGGFSCRCGGTFCAYHRYSDRHDCNFDYREMGATQIRRDNPVIVPDKLRKL